MNEIVPRCPRCGSANFQVNTEEVQFRWLSNSWEDLLEPSPEDTSESYKQLSMGQECCNMLEESMSEADTFLQSLHTIHCNHCDYMAIFEEVGLTYWHDLIKLNDDLYIYESSTGGVAGLADTLLLCLTVAAATKYNKLKLLYTTNNIADLAEFLADPKLHDIAKRRYDDIMKGDVT